MMLCQSYAHIATVARGHESYDISHSYYDDFKNTMAALQLKGLGLIYFRYLNDNNLPGARAGYLSKLAHIGRMLVGPFGAFRFQSDIDVSVDQMSTVLHPGHVWISADLPTIAREAGLKHDYTPAEAFRTFLESAASLKSPEDVLFAWLIS